MDLTQRKLSKSEWDSIEKPVSTEELDILNLIHAGFSNVNIRRNATLSVMSFLKLAPSNAIEDCLYTKHFATRVAAALARAHITTLQFTEQRRSIVRAVTKSHDGNTMVRLTTPKHLNSASTIRMKRADDEGLNSLVNRGLYEFVLLDALDALTHKPLVTTNTNTNAEAEVTTVGTTNKEDNMWMGAYYTLAQLSKNHVEGLNPVVQIVVAHCLDHFAPHVSPAFIVAHAHRIIEQNPLLLKYVDTTLYDHQKQIFARIKGPAPKLVLYVAPTGTGKTLTPIGLASRYRVIFVCAARHVGLALGRAAISMGRRVAFAFGCACPADVRLHYSAAKEYEVNKRSGMIGKIDNTVGDNVEILICDVRSYVPAMHYMLAFNAATDLVTYWDEPTITLDQEAHELHDIIQQNWVQNVIPTMVLSSATLPRLDDLEDTVADFCARFSEGVHEPEVINIVSHDCRKSIPLINTDGRIVLPHLLDSTKFYEGLQACVRHCETNLTLMRYFDMEGISRFIQRVLDDGQIRGGVAEPDVQFAQASDIDMNAIKRYYLQLLRHLRPEYWAQLRAELDGAPVAPVLPVVPKKEDHVGVFVTTHDAHTLTDGATLYIAKDLQKIARFCIHQANIPSAVMDDIMAKIEFNNIITDRINEIHAEIDEITQRVQDKMGGGSADTSRAAKKLTGGKKSGKSSAKIASNVANREDNEKMVQMRDEAEVAKNRIKSATLNDLFIPNKPVHMEKWVPSDTSVNTRTSFTSDISDDIVKRIMLLTDVDNSWKVLLLLGIGIFTDHRSSAYTEVMKMLADQQKLYLIIADSDYIYGTNYQFCHAYLGKDLEMTQEKIVQALGRVGRNNIQQTYSVRFRDRAHVEMLFADLRPDEKREVVNMNRLFAASA
jgi:hypothetical protein